MSNRWPSILIGFLIAIALALASERAYHTYTWAAEVNLQARAAAGYLGAPIPGIQKPDGSPVRRYELIDVAIQEYINTHKAPATK